MSKTVIKRDGSTEPFDARKVTAAAEKAYKDCGKEMSPSVRRALESAVVTMATGQKDTVGVEDIQDTVESVLMDGAPYDVARNYILYRERHKSIRDFADKKLRFIERYKRSDNTANATVDDNSNVSSKNIGILNCEIHKTDNILVNRRMIVEKIKTLYPGFDSKQYVADLERHIIYKGDESSFAGAIAPYCCAISMYPFLTDGLKNIGGLSAAPKNLDSFCGMYINMIFAIAAMFAGAVATPEALLYFSWFARKEWGDDYWRRPDEVVTAGGCRRQKTIRGQIHQYFQQIVYSINQPAAARGLQSAFVNFSYFDKPFFDGMFGEFRFPDGSRPVWEALDWLQKEFMQWFNEERLRCVLTFPVESFALLYKDGEFLDKENAEFVAQEYARGHSFFTYISDTVDSLSSCCFAKDTKVLWKSSSSGVRCTTLEELYSLPWRVNKKNLRIFHNGSWVRGKCVKLPGRKMFKVVTVNNDEYLMTDNHINVTYDGEKETSSLSADDYLMYSTKCLYPIKENDRHLTYEQGLLIGLFLGDGTLGDYVCLDGSVHSFQLSLNEWKWEKVKPCLRKLCRPRLRNVYNNVYPVYIYGKDLVTFVCEWTDSVSGETYAYNKRLNLNCLLQSVEFRRGILDGWYITGGGNSNRCYTTSKGLADDMQILIMSLGMQSRCDISGRRDEDCVIRGSAYRRNWPLYCVRFFDQNNTRTRPESGFRWKNNSVFWKIKSVEEVPCDGDVYCIERQDREEPYFTLPTGLITHNCRLRNKLNVKEFSFTNGNMGIQTGSKSVMTLNLSRITQDFCREQKGHFDYAAFKDYLMRILERVYKYQTAYNELLWDMYDAGLLPVYKAGFISLDKQYLTIGINGLNEAAEYLGMRCSDNENYKMFCTFVFSVIKEANAAHKTKRTTFNTEQIPAESLAVKNYNWDKEDGYWVPEDRNLYASYIFIPSDPGVSILDKIRMHGREYIGDYLDGGAACHLNLDAHLSVEQYRKVLRFAAENGCQYFTFNVPNSECDDCGFITKVPVTECPRCHSKNISYYDRVIGYLTKVKNWSKGRQIEQKKRVYSDGRSEIK